MNKKNPKANRMILGTAYAVAGIFVCMLLYFGYMIQFSSETMINNSYNNARLDSFAERIVRGKILSRDGQVLARTQTDEEGTETRVYPFGSLFNHVVGYSSMGKTGLESLANFYLLTSHVNLIEQAVNQMAGVKNQGDSVITTLDVNLQQTAWDALGDRNGAVAVMEPDTGKILAMVSKPGFDPNEINDEWEELTQGDSREGRLLNRASQGLYPPGSIFKIVTVLEYMREHPDDWEEFSYDCQGTYQADSYVIQCYHQMAHGQQNLVQAFANSCNGAFASMGLELDLGQMKELAEELLFNSELPFSLPYQKSTYVMDEGADTWTILQTSIGQGETQVTPLHMLMLTCAVANGGTLMKPYLIDHVETDDGETVKKFMPASYGQLMTAEESARLTALMEQVVLDGTGSALQTSAYSAAGKTGSAEFETGKESHAWFVGFAPSDDPQIAVCVIVEEGGSGGRTAGPVAKSVFDAYFLR